MRVFAKLGDTTPVFESTESQPNYVKRHIPPERGAMWTYDPFRDERHHLYDTDVEEVEITHKTFEDYVAEVKRRRDKWAVGDRVQWINPVGTVYVIAEILPENQARVAWSGGRKSDAVSMEKFVRAVES